MQVQLVRLSRGIPCTPTLPLSPGRKVWRSRRSQRVCQPEPTAGAMLLATICSFRRASAYAELRGRAPTGHGGSARSRSSSSPLLPLLLLS